MIENQFGRRNLPNFVRAELALKLKPLIAERAKEKQLRKPESVKQNSAEQKPIETREELAKKAGVSHDTIAKTEKILANCDDETISQLRSGEISVNQAHKAATGQHSATNNEDEYYTPACYIESARLVMGGIELDPASCEDS